MDTILKILEKDYFPDFLIRYQIRKLLQSRIDDEKKSTEEEFMNSFQGFLSQLKASPVAIHTDAANEQHYEVPTEFYKFVMGKRLKYSSGYWPKKDTNFQESEDAMLDLYIERSQTKDGMRILDLGCGWGSVSLYFAEKFPKSQITGVSNSKTQKAYILGEAKKRGLKNLEILTQDMNTFKISKTFDRIISVEMLEHMRNYQVLFERLSKLLAKDGKFFIHIFTHKEYGYPFEVKDETDWMSKYFFTGGQMPSDHQFLYFQDDLKIEKHWRVDGTHYSRTSRAWLENMTANREKIYPIFEATYGKENATKWWVYWRVFFMACEELWAFNKGREWIVSHYLFSKR